jgi:hypothetical protein
MPVKKTVCEKPLECCKDQATQTTECYDPTKCEVCVGGKVIKEASNNDELKKKCKECQKTEVKDVADPTIVIHTLYNTIDLCDNPEFGTQNKPNCCFGTCWNEDTDKCKRCDATLGVVDKYDSFNICEICDPATGNKITKPCPQGKECCPSQSEECVDICHCDGDNTMTPCGACGCCEPCEKCENGNKITGASISSSDEFECKVCDKGEKVSACGTWGTCCGGKCISNNASACEYCGYSGSPTSTCTNFSPNCCGTECWNQDTDRCYKCVSGPNRPPVLVAKCGISDPNHIADKPLCCNGQCYDPKGCEICINNTTLRYIIETDSEGCCTNYDGDRIVSRKYTKATHTCCNGDIVPKNECCGNSRINTNGIKCCNDLPYNTDTDMCCDNKIIKKTDDIDCCVYKDPVGDIFLERTYETRCEKCTTDGVIKTYDEGCYSCSWEEGPVLICDSKKPDCCSSWNIDTANDKKGKCWNKELQKCEMCDDGSIVPVKGLVEFPSYDPPHKTALDADDLRGVATCCGGKWYRNTDDSLLLQDWAPEFLEFLGPLNIGPKTCYECINDSVDKYCLFEYDITEKLWKPKDVKKDPKIECCIVNGVRQCYSKCEYRCVPDGNTFKLEENTSGSLSLIQDVTNAKFKCCLFTQTQFNENCEICTPMGVLPRLDCKSCCDYLCCKNDCCDGTPEFCCPDNSPKCVGGGLCCKNDEIKCGSVCCPSNRCSGNGICCPEGQEVCGSSGACCPIGSCCANGECASSNQICCGGSPKNLNECSECCNNTCVNTSQKCCNDTDNNQFICSDNQICCGDSCCNSGDACCDGTCYNSLNCEKCTNFGIVGLELNEACCAGMTYRPIDCEKCENGVKKPYISTSNVCFCYKGQEYCTCPIAGLRIEIDTENTGHCCDAATFKVRLVSALSGQGSIIGSVNLNNSDSCIPPFRQITVSDDAARDLLNNLVGQDCCNFRLELVCDPTGFGAFQPFGPDQCHTSIANGRVFKTLSNGSESLIWSGYLDNTGTFNICDETLLP